MLSTLYLSELLGIKASRFDLFTLTRTVSLLKHHVDDPLSNAIVHRLLPGLRHLAAEDTTYTCSSVATTQYGSCASSERRWYINAMAKECKDSAKVSRVVI
jgi:hypothetical protein